MKILKWLGVFVGACLLLLIFTIGPIDRTPLVEQPFYQKMMVKLDSSKPKVAHGKIEAAWNRVNITPSGNMPMAGYTVRDHFDSVHDSLYANLLLLKIGNKRVALISLDLLIFPPKLKKRLLELQENNHDSTFLYLSASHTHNGVGGWDDSIGGEIAFGDYHKEWIELTAQKLLKQLQVAYLPAKLKYWESEANNILENRITVKEGVTEGTIRGLIIERSDSTTACLFSYSAHATSIRKKIQSLSGDYPAAVIQNLSKKFNFTMFMSGMVGSHMFNIKDVENFDLVKKVSDSVTHKIFQRKEFIPVDSITISTANIPIEFGSSQLRITKNLKINDWLFRAVFNRLQGNLTYLKLGNVVMLGTPCDFSGEIFVRQNLKQLQSQNTDHLFITSFNGDYTGYITYDGHYDTQQHTELYEMNWVGPYYGDYFSRIIQKVYLW